MYHFTADHPPEPVRLSYHALIPGHIRQYLKDFQLDAITFMHNFLAKREFCVYNDESGLGKQAAVVVLLGAACSSRKCLIVVQNDDRYLSAWEFHFNVLTNTNVMVIKDATNTTDSPHCIYIAKWSILRTLDDLSKLKFDFIILDNRGQMLNNSFCTSMLLKHYERKVNILISSVDITSDLKLFYNVLRLGGHIDSQYSSFKAFEHKFKLPDAKELAYKRIDLEEYFCKRERLADYCKAFRLRRYCHQFESQLPLVKEDRYKINLDLWHEKQNASNSESSSIKWVNHSNGLNDNIKDTQELFEEYCKQKRKQQIQFQQEEEKRLRQREGKMFERNSGAEKAIYGVDNEVALINEAPFMKATKPLVDRENSDELVFMSPLMVESDSDANDTPEIYNDRANDIEIVDLSSEENEEENYKRNEDHNTVNMETNLANDSSKSSFSTKNLLKRKSLKRRSELDRLEEDIVDALKIKELPKRISRQNKDKDNSITRSNKRLLDRLEGRKTCIDISKTAILSPKNEYKSATPKSYLEKTGNENSKDTLNVSKIVLRENFRKSKTSNRVTKKNTSRSPSNSTPNLNSVKKIKRTLKDSINTNKPNNTSPLTSNSIQIVGNISNENKKEILEDTPHVKKVKLKNLQAKGNSEKIHLKREMQISPAGIHLKETRSMQRLTRSASTNKYLTKNLSLQIDKISKPKKKSIRKETSKRKEVNKNNVINHNGKRKSKKEMQVKIDNAVKNTQTSIISHRSSQDYESLQCAQRLSGPGIFDNGVEKATVFLVPSTPNTIERNSLIPLSLTSSAGFFTESEIIFIHPNNLNNGITSRKHDPVISISSSDNENSNSQSSSTNVSITSRRTRALKPKRNNEQTVGTTSKLSSFSNLLVQKNTRSSFKSPDLFSNCSDFIQLPCTQPNFETEKPNKPFEGFKIFGSEVKQLQQQYASNRNHNINTHNPNLKKSYSEQRSCLDLLENMFQPSNKKPKQFTNEKPSMSTKNLSRGEAAAIPQKTHTQILPSHPIEAITEARQQQELLKKKPFTITSFSGLQDDDIFEIINNGTFGSVMRLHSNGDVSPVQQTQKTNGKQPNKITNYLIGNNAQNISQEELALNGGNEANNIIVEAGTPSKRHQQLPAVQNINVKKSPKSKCNTTQTTKLTKWFTKPSKLCANESSSKAKSFSNSSLKRTPTKQVLANEEVNRATITLSSPSKAGKRILKRRRLDLSFKE